MIRDGRNREMVLAALCLGALLCLAAGRARGHEGHRHDAMGTVQSVEAEKVVLKTTQGQEMTFSLSAATTVRRGSVEVGRAGIEVGERAVVTYEAEKDGNHAIEIKLGEKRP